MEPTAQHTGKPMRADAVRNRAKILGAAREQITLHGADVGMDEIAAAAGVAVGTMYGHFPTKTHLVAAVVTEFLTQVADRSEAAAAAVENGQAAFDQLTALMHDIVHATANNQAAKAAASSLGTDEVDAVQMQRAGVALQSVIDRARSDGTVRSDLVIGDFYLLVSNIPAGQPSEVLARWMDLVLNGITKA